MCWCCCYCNWCRKMHQPKAENEVRSQSHQSQHQCFPIFQSIPWWQNSHLTCWNWRLQERTPLNSELNQTEGHDPLTCPMLGWCCRSNPGSAQLNNSKRWLEHPWQKTVMIAKRVVDKDGDDGGVEKAQNAAEGAHQHWERIGFPWRNRLVKPKVG